MEDWAGVRRTLPSALAPQDVYSPGEAAVRIQPVVAPAMAKAGDVAGAEALIALTRLDCYVCGVAWGEVAAVKGDHAAAERWFADATRRGPSLPWAPMRWAQARFDRGDLTGALRLAWLAHKRGPRWADPLKLEGDVLARRGDHRAALRRYEAALERAPRWGAAHLAAGRSLQALGRPEQARARYAQAARLDLSAADRAQVRSLLEGPR